MTPLLNNRQGSRLLVTTLLFLFVGMEVSLLSWPMDYFEPIPGKTTDSHRRKTLLNGPPNVDQERQRTDASSEGVQENPLSDGTEITDDSQPVPSRPLVVSSRLSLSRFNSSRLSLSHPQEWEKNLAVSVIIPNTEVSPHEGNLPNREGLIQSLIPEYRALPNLAECDEQIKTERSQIIAQFTTTSDLLKCLNSYSLYNRVLESYLLRREAIFPDDSGSEENSNHLNQQTSKALQLIATRGVDLIKTVLPTFEDAVTIDTTAIGSLTLEQRTSLCDTLSLIRKMQLFILGYSTTLCMTESKKKLDEIESFLDQNPSHKDGNTSQEVETFYQESKDLLRTRKALFSLKETLPIEATIEAAQKSAQLLENQLSKIRDSKQIFEGMLTRADTSTVSSLQKEISFMSQLEVCLQDAITIYYTIEDEGQIEQHYDSLHNLKSEIENAASLLSTKNKRSDSTSSNSSDPITALTEPLSGSNFQLDHIASLPQHPSLFLENLERLNPTSKESCIVGHRGKIFLEKLADYRDDSYFLEHQPEWVLGINTIREGLRRGWGIHVVHAFDSQFAFMIQHKIALTVRDLKKFLLNEDGTPKYARSFFIPQEMIRESFLKHLEDFGESLNHTSTSFNKTIGDQVIKFDAATLDFNPFDKKPITTSQESIEDAELRQRQAGFDRVREALKSAFPEASLLPRQLEEVLHEFDTKFKLEELAHVTQKTPLTLANAATFIRDQKIILQNRSYWNRHITPYLNRDALIMNALNGLSYTIGSHLGTTILFALPYLYIFWLNHIHHTTSSST